MVPDESKKSSPIGRELVHSFQVLAAVNEALGLIEQGADASAVRRATSSVQERFDKCEAILDRLPGGALTRADQEAEIRRLGEELERKRSLVSRYSEHDVISRVLAQRSLPSKDGDAVDAVDAGEDAPAEIEDDMMKMDRDSFGDVEIAKQDESEDMLMGLEI